MKISGGLGVVIIAAVAVVLLLLGLVTLLGALAFFLFAAGAWCVVSSIIATKKTDKYYLVGIGLILASLATAYFIPLRYSLAMALIFAIVVTLLSRFKPLNTGRSQNNLNLKHQ